MPPTEVISGLFQLKVPIPNNPLGYVLPYLIPGDDGYTLVDCGWNTDEAFEALESQLRELSVSFDDIKRLLEERPEAIGLSVPGMPIGSPGMEVEGRPADNYDVMLITEGGSSVFASH